MSERANRLAVCLGDGVGALIACGVCVCLFVAPWEHVISVGVFAFLGKTYSDQYQKMRLSLYDELGMFNRHAEGIKWQMAEKEQ